MIRDITRFNVYNMISQNEYSKSNEYFLYNDVNGYSFCETTWRRHQMETFSALLAFSAGNSSVTGEFLSQSRVARNFDVFFD